MQRALLFSALLIGLWLICYARRKKYGYTAMQSTLIGIVTVVFGVLGTYLLGWVEAGRIGNISYYGSVFAVPLIMLPVSRFTNTPYGKIMDYVTPCGSAAIALGKIGCFFNGCCGGRMVSFAGRSFCFPSQLTEMFVAIVITALVLEMEKSKAWQNCRYAAFLLSYGAARFVLNLLREHDVLWLGLPQGNWWSILALVIGAIWLLCGIGRKKGIV